MCIRDRANTLLFVSLDAYNWTVGYGLNNNGQTEVLTRTRENGINNVNNILFHSKNNKLDLVDMIYMLNYYIHQDPNHDMKSGDRTCWNSKTSVVAECGAVNSVITSLSKTSCHTLDSGDKYCAIEWNTLHDNVDSLQLEYSNDGQNFATEVISGASRSFFLLKLNNPEGNNNDQIVRIKALVDGVWSEYVAVTLKAQR